MFYQGWKKGEDKYVVKYNIAEYYPLLWVAMQDNIFTRTRQEFLDKKPLKKLGSTRRIMRERDFLFFVSFYCHCVKHPSLASGRENICYIILR